MWELRKRMTDLQEDAVRKLVFAFLLYFRWERLLKIMRMKRMIWAPPILNITRIRNWTTKNGSSRFAHKEPSGNHRKLTINNLYKIHVKIKDFVIYM